MKEKKMTNWTLNIKAFCLLKNTIKKKKTLLGESIYKAYLTKDFYLEYRKLSYNPIIRRETTQQKRAKDLNRYFTKEDM